MDFIFFTFLYRFTLYF